jgi:hypothetical protein
MTAFVTLGGVDAYSRDVQKTYEAVEALPDDADVDGVALQADYDAISMLGLTKRIVTSETIVTGSSPASNANRDEGATIRVRLDDNSVYPLRIPAPVIGIRNSDGSIDITDSIVTDFVANFLVGGKFRLGRGRYVVSILNGQLDK